MAKKSSGTIAEYILKHKQKREKNLKYDFMPQLLEIIERPTHIASKVIIIGIALLIVSAVIWSSISKIDVVVSGTGSIELEEDLCITSSKVGGIVKEIYVSEGDYVKKGDVLLELNRSEIDKEVEFIQKELELLRIKHEVLLTYYKDIDAKVDVTDYDESYLYVINDIIYANELYKLQRNQVLTQKEILDLQYNSNLNSQIAKVEESIRVYEAQLIQKSTELEKMILKADTSGYIISSLVNYEGQVINGLQELFVIAPENTQYIFKGYIADKNISEVTVGDLVQIKLQAYSFSDFGAVAGKITYINPIATSKEGMGNLYEVIIQIDENKLHKDIQLKSGLTGSIEVKIGKRSVLDYFLEPIVGELNNSMKEK